MSERVLIVASHPDDEVLGMAGTIAMHSSQGDTVSILFLGNGVGARGAKAMSETTQRIAAANLAAKILGATIEAVHDFPDNRMDTVPLLDVVKAVEAAKGKLTPTLVYTHHAGDLNVDHQLCCRAVLTAFRPQPHELCKEIRTFEVNSSTEWAVPSLSGPFQPNLYVDVSQYEDLIYQAVSSYVMEMRPEPHARSLEMIINGRRMRGGQVGVSLAEAFMSVRRLLV